jgi:DNA-binding HxlR family transcriptional regulator
MVKRRKSQVLPPPSECPIKAVMGMLGGRWTTDIIWYLRAGKRCFTELRLDLKGISAKVLTQRLRKLELNGIVVRSTQLTSPPTVWYELTPAGQELALALVNVLEVSQRLVPGKLTAVAGSRK